VLALRFKQALASTAANSLFFAVYKKKFNKNQIYEIFIHTTSPLRFPFLVKSKEQV
jgi:hypothetical protein